MHNIQNFKCLKLSFLLCGPKSQNQQHAFLILPPSFKMFSKINQKVKLHQSFITLKIDPKILFIRIHAKLTKEHFTELWHWLQMFVCHLVEHVTVFSNIYTFSPALYFINVGCYLKQVIEVNNEKHERQQFSPHKILRQLELPQKKKQSPLCMQNSVLQIRLCQLTNTEAGIEKDEYVENQGKDLFCFVLFSV